MRKNGSISDDLKKTDLKLDQENHFIHSVEFLEESDSSSVIVNLKDKAKLYTADIKTIYDSISDLPFVQFYFSGNYPYSYPEIDKKL